MKIQVLSEIVSQRIAAGEVVERPASIIKELVENSVDAGATAISISIHNGGISRIRVADNGCGIAPEDMPLAVTNHATSKIYTLSDLENICSMGFRGEALASICAVAHVTVKSRVRGSECGTELFSKGGKTEYIRDAGLSEGTSITVEELFFNTPARLKFLKKPSAEAAAISEIVSKLILANPDISIRYLSGENEIYHSPGGGDLRGAIMSVYGPEVAGRLLPISLEMGSVRVSGYIGESGLTYRTQRHGGIFLNGRYIRAPFINTAVSRAYGERLLKGSYPFFVLNLSIDAGKIDVNVHPNKLTVHFNDEGAVEYAVSNAVADALAKNASTPVMQLGKTENPAPEVNKAPRMTPPMSAEETKKAVQEVMAQAAETAMRRSGGELRQREFPSFAPPQAHEPTHTAPKPAVNVQEAPVVAARETFALPPEKGDEEPAEQISLLQDIVEYEIIGSIFSAYILVQAGDCLYVIDQHAAHERMLYDRLMEEQGEYRVVQPLIAPYTFTATPEEHACITANAQIIEQMGIDLKQTGPLAYSITALPQILGRTEPGALIQDVLEELLGSAGEHQSPNGITARRARIAKGACRRAVKAGQRLPRSQMDALLQDILRNHHIPHCPHGRPIAVAIPKKEIEKAFKRIV